MAEIRPFRCIHPAQGLESRVAALPYDVYSREEAAVEAAKDPLSFLNIDRPETQFPPEQDMYAPEVYRKADELLRQRRAEGVFVKEKEAGYGLYEQTMQGRTQTGIVACASIDEYLQGVIRRHENTRPEKEEDRVRHVDACSAQTGPIFLAYRKHPVLARLTAEVKQEEPLFDFTTEDGIRHRGWQIHREDRVRLIRETFQKIDRIYIADGHHRAASAVRVGLERRKEHPDYDGSEEFNFFLSILFPDEELRILDYNRVVRDLNGWTEPTFLKRLEETFEVSLPENQEEDQAVPPHRRGELRMYLHDRWYQLLIRPQLRSTDPVEDLDVSILQKSVLAPVLGITDPGKDPRIGFIGGIRGLEELVRRVHTDCAVAFALYPTSIRELFAVADEGRLMPPKSTWFEPKLRSGLYIHEIER